MRLAIYGSDERVQALKELAAAKDYILTDVRPDAVVLPLPRARYGDVKRNLCEGQLVIAGGMDEALQLAAKEGKWRVYSVMEDELFQRENALFTAEGSIWKLMEKRKKAICNSRCLIVGFGRIGKALQKILLAMGADVIVAARRKESREAAGPGSIDMGEIQEIIGKMDVIFNTVPCHVISEESMKMISPNAVVMELASPPYGMDMGLARAMDIQVMIEGGLPARYCPRDAAGAWLRCVERSVGAK